MSEIKGTIKEFDDSVITINVKATETYKNLQQRIDKAIEYIKTTNFWGLYDDTPMEEVKYGEDLLEILKGENK